MTNKYKGNRKSLLKKIQAIKIKTYRQNCRRLQRKKALV